jgi:GntR family transcriptional repressor for pyruvate dehydrogenase complex
MSDAIAEMFGALKDPQQFLVHDVSFHRAVASASGNPTLATLIEMVSAVLYSRRRETIERAHDFNESLELHRSVYRAIRARKPDEAREAMREHIVRALGFCPRGKATASNNANAKRSSIGRTFRNLSISFFR